MRCRQGVGYCPSSAEETAVLSRITRGTAGCAICPSSAEEGQAATQEKSRSLRKRLGWCWPIDVFDQHHPARGKEAAQHFLMPRSAPPRLRRGICDPAACSQHRTVVLQTSLGAGETAVLSGIRRGTAGCAICPSSAQQTAMLSGIRRGTPRCGILPLLSRGGASRDSRKVAKHPRAAGVVLVN